MSLASKPVGDNENITEAPGARQLYAEIRKRFEPDAELRRVALGNGYDSIVLMTTPEYQKFSAEGKIPRRLELNILDLSCLASNEPGRSGCLRRAWKLNLSA